MKKNIFLSLFFMSSLLSFAQITFEKGYFLNERDQRTECLIKNVDWKDNPTKFEYKLSENGKVEIGTINMVKEFGINGFSKYIRANVEIDRSSHDLTNLSKTKAPEFSKEQLYLKLLVEGKASLYMYEENNVKKFFFNIDSGPIKELINKTYRIDIYTVRTNTEYRMQLFRNLKCGNKSISDYEYLSYFRNTLVKEFATYNECIGAEFKDYESKRATNSLNFTIKAKLSNNVLEVRDFSGVAYDFGNQLQPEFGLEIENILPFNNNKWSVFMELAFNRFSGDVSQTTGNATFGFRELNLSMDYKSLEVAPGFRHFLFLNEKSKLFLNVIYVFDISSSSSKLSSNRALDGDPRQSLEFPTGRSSNFAFGMGFNYLNTYSFEVRVDTGRRVFSIRDSWTGDYTSLSFVLGYTIF